MIEKGKRYDEEFKKSIVELHRNGRSMNSLSKEYEIGTSSIAKWVKSYDTVKMDDGQIYTAKEVRRLQTEKARLEEENLILKKAVAIFTPQKEKE